MRVWRPRPMYRLPVLVPSLLVACLWPSPALPAQRGTPPARPAPARAPEPRDEALPTPEQWRALVARDRTVRFTDRTPSEARALLALDGLSPDRRAAALVALGCASAEGERTRLETTARSGTGVERWGAILALGEMNAGATALLLDLVANEDARTAECALLALLRDGRNSGRRRVEELAYDPVHPHAEAARELLVLALDPESSAPSRAGHLLLRLRWEAAREFGLVEGQAWRVLAIQALGRDPALLTEVVLGALPVLTRPGVADHLLPLVMHGTGDARLRAAVAILPRELALVVENGLWAPRDAAEWRVLLDEIDQQRVERLTPEIARAALEVPEVRWRGLALAALAGDESLGGWLDVDAATLPVPERIDLCVALGALPNSTWLGRFAALGEDPDARVRAAYLVAGFRQGLRKPEVEVEAVLSDAEHAGHAPLVAALCRVARDPDVALALENRLAEAEGDERLEIATALSLAGRLSGRATVRLALSSDPPPRGARAVRLVRALARNKSSEDLEVFRALFPRPDDRQLDVELARTLVQLGDAAAEPLLRTALWRGEFDVSVLAGGLLLQRSGPLALLRELQNPPVDAASSDLRRVGWAAGEWGGWPEFERLSRELRAGPAHPAVQGAWLGALAARTH